MDLYENSENVLVRKHKDHPTTPAFNRWQVKIETSSVFFFEETPCWLWLGCKSKTTGYGQFKMDARRGSTVKVGPHVFAYLYYIGEIPAGYEVHHRCYQRACCNPRHLELKTHKENVFDSTKNPATRNAQKTHCVNGHEFTPENTHNSRNGARVCKICRRNRIEAFRRRHNLKY